MRLAFTGTLGAQLLVLCSFGQYQNRVWHFGSYAGLDFSTAPPTALLSGRYSGASACGSICDSTGALVFYAAPDTFYNAAHDTITGGTAVYGDATAMSSVVVPWPGHPREYFVFTAKSAGAPDNDPKGFYHRVDMNPVDGMVAEAQVLMHDPVSTLVCGVMHSNGDDFWVIMHEWGSDHFLSFLVSEVGVSLSPVVSTIGEVHQTGAAVRATGVLKASRSGDRLALVMTRTSASDRYVDLFSFDASSGIVSDPLRIGDSDAFYGVEFSPNGQVLYVSIRRCDPGSVSELVQYDLAVNDSALIVASAVVLHTVPLQINCDGNMGTMSLAPDRRIYVAIRFEAFLGVVEQPDVLGIGCGYQHATVDLLGRINNLVLPNQVKFPDSTVTSVGASQKESGGLRIWPSPAGDVVWIVWPGIRHAAFVDVRCYNILGDKVLEQRTRLEPSSHLDVSGFAQGVYTLQVSDAVSGATVSASFVKH